MSNHKIIRCILGIVLCLLLTGCSDEGYEEAKVEASQIEKQYEKEFERQITDYYGEDAVLKDVKGRVLSRHVGVWFDHVYYSVPVLDGKLMYCGDEYDVSYNVESKQLKSTVDSEIVTDAFLSLLPFDPEKIVCRFTYDSSYEEPQFVVSGGDPLSILAETTADHKLYWCILTTEDISDLEAADFGEYLDYEKENGGGNAVNVFACKEDGFTNIEHLMQNAYSCGASNYGHHPNVYFDKEYTDIFSVYNLKNTCSVGTEGFTDDNGNGQIDLEFQLLSDSAKDEPLREYHHYMNRDEEQ